MSIDPNKFGISNSLVQAVNEALKGGQVKLDKNHNGKLDAQDFKMLRKEEGGDATNPKQGSSVNPKQREIDEGNPANKAKKNAAAAAVGAQNRDAHHTAKRGMRTDVADKIRGREVMQGQPRVRHEEVEVTEAEDAVAKQIAAKKDQFKKQLQQKIAAKQMNTMQAKANKRLSNIHASNDKCTCQEGKGKSMSCEVCNGGKSMKGGKEKIEVNPPMREATELPKKVITKGHEIAKSIIKHKGKVDNPYAVGMAAAKKSAGIKEDAEQVDEISAGLAHRATHAAWIKTDKAKAAGKSTSKAAAQSRRFAQYASKKGAYDFNKKD